MSNGLVLWQGASLIDGKPIVVVATGLQRSSANAKTGDLVQTYILCADVQPTDAVKTGADVSICGNCPHRGDGTGKGRTCYVQVGQGPLAVWRAWKRGAYPAASYPWDTVRSAGVGRVVRLGTYGDPAAVPYWVWEQLTDGCVGHTGYTHQWRVCDPALKSLVMASADSVQDATDAHAAGWRTFRVAMPCDPAKLAGEAQCPASAEMGKRLTCEQCRACNGNATGRRGSIVIQAHGGLAVMANVRSKFPVPHTVQS